MLFSSIIEGGMDLSKLPEGWPGTEIIEGKTLTNVPIKPESKKGPAAREGSGFLNPAMAGSRTRSVLMLNDALENNWLVKSDAQIRVIDALAATSIRSRRWLNEIPLSGLIEDARKIEDSVKEVFEKAQTMLPAPAEKDDDQHDPMIG